MILRPPSRPVVAPVALTAGTVQTAWWLIDTPAHQISLSIWGRTSNRTFMSDESGFVEMMADSCVPSVDKGLDVWATPEVDEGRLWSIRGVGSDVPLKQNKRRASLRLLFIDSGSPCVSTRCVLSAHFSTCGVGRQAKVCIMSGVRYPCRISVALWTQIWSLRWYQSTAPLAHILCLVGVR